MDLLQKWTFFQQKINHSVKWIQTAAKVIFHWSIWKTMSTHVFIGKYLERVNSCCYLFTVVHGACQQELLVDYEGLQLVVELLINMEQQDCSLINYWYWIIWARLTYGWSLINMVHTLSWIMRIGKYGVYHPSVNTAGQVSYSVRGKLLQCMVLILVLP